MSNLPRPRGGPLCPVDRSHGPLIDWPTDRWAYYCPDSNHDGWKDRPATRAFFTTTEAERGSLMPEPLTGADTPAAQLLGTK